MGSPPDGGVTVVEFVDPEQGLCKVPTVLLCPPGGDTFDVEKCS